MFLRVIFLSLLSIHMCTYAQTNLALQLEFEMPPSTIKITKLKAFFGQFEFVDRNDDTTLIDDYLLVDWMNEPFINFEGIEIQNLKSISFLIGVDSNQIINGVMEGALDPGNGMFWTWQSGYINFKFEFEESDADRVFHIGGYKGKQNTAYRITIDIPVEKRLYGVSFQTTTFIEFIKANNLSKVMSPGETAVDIAQHYDQFITPIWNEENR